MMMGVKSGLVLGFDERIQSVFQGFESDHLLGFFEAVSTIGSTMVIGGGSVTFPLMVVV